MIRRSLFALMVLPGLLDPLRGQTDGELLVRGRGVAITRAQLEEEEACHFDEVGPMKAAMRPATVDFRVLNSLINKYAVLARARDQDRAAAGERFRANLKDHKIATKLTDEAFEQRLERRLTVWRLSRKRWEERNIENCVMQIVLNREVEACVSDEQIRQYYARHATRFDQPEMVRVQRVLVTTVDAHTGLRLPPARLGALHAGLNELREKARAGSDMRILAAAFAEAHPGEVTTGEITFPRGQMPTEVETAAFSLRPGETSEVIASDSGYQLLRGCERLPPRRQPLDEVRAQIRASLVLQMIPRYLEHIKHEAGIEIVNADLKAEQLAASRDAAVDALPDAAPISSP